MKKLGYSSLSVIAKNPAPGIADKDSKNKPIKVAADDTSNLWSKETAIAFYDWADFYNAGKKIACLIGIVIGLLCLALGSI